ncbi:MAG: hypothetical protein IM568_02390 [Flavobacterium sp.]|nr:hypothetical protein [Flavobacterium sp.]
MGTKKKIFFNKWKKVVLVFLGIPILLFGILILVISFKKDAIIQELLVTANADFKGKMALYGTQISPFENFPYISIDIKDFQVFETKATNQKPIINLKDVYVGFDLWTIISGKYDVKTIKLANGKINIIQYKDHSYNLVKAFETNKKIEDVEEEFHIDLQKIKLQNIVLQKTNLVDAITLNAYVSKAETKFKKDETHIKMGLDTKFVFNVIKGKDTTFIKNKHFDIATAFSFHKKSQLLQFESSTVTIENGVFGLEGKVDIKNNFDLDLVLTGKKPNFDLLIAFAPEDLIPTLRKYDNQGDIFFKTTVKGKSINGNLPAVEAKFGCKKGFFDNTITNKKLDDMTFSAYFTNGSKRNLETSAFYLTNFSAKPEAGRFKGNLKVINFISPEIDLKLDSDFDLEFLSKFFNLKNLSNVTGNIQLSMNFHDIIDLSNPEKSLKKFNQAYYSELLVTNLNFKSERYHLPVKNLNLKAIMDGNDIKMDYCRLQLGKSNLEMNGIINNIPAIIHQTNGEVVSEIHVKSKLLDFKELTAFDTIKQKPFNEKVRNLKLDLAFKGAASTFLQSKSLPVGNYFIQNLYAKLENYPHVFHDFGGLFEITENDINVKKFSGQIDTSDFAFDGKIASYNLWFADKKIGDTQMEFDLTSNALHFKDLFSYNGKNYVPKEYRDEDVKGLKFHGRVALHFKDSLQSTDFYVDEFKGKFKVHPVKFEQFKGNIHAEKDVLTINNVSGTIGKSNFTLSGRYHLKNNSYYKINGDYFNFQSTYLDFDELFSYKEQSTNANVKVDHDSGFNLFEIPFKNIKIDATIGHLNYHKYVIKKMTAKLRIKENHMVHFDNCQFNAAGGIVNLKGYLNGSNPKNIYLNPDLKIQKVNLDQVLYKFDNFGQDKLVSENLHGIFTGRITGKILLHTDLTPRIDDSNLQMDVVINNGRLDNFGPIQAMSNFFKDKNLSKVLFDKLENRLVLKNGRLILPNMVVNSSLGFIQLSGSQDRNMNMEYYLRIPLRMVTGIAFQKLFGRKREALDANQEDEIIYKDPNKRVRYINLKISGTPSNYKISLEKNKDIKNGKGFVKDESFLFDDLENESTENTQDTLKNI